MKRMVIIREPAVNITEAIKRIRFSTLRSSYAGQLFEICNESLGSMVANTISVEEVSQLAPSRVPLGRIGIVSAHCSGQLPGVIPYFRLAVFVRCPASFAYRPCPSSALLHRNRKDDMTRAEYGRPLSVIHAVSKNSG